MFEQYINMNTQNNRYSILLLEINNNDDLQHVDPLLIKKIPLFAQAFHSPSLMSKFITMCIDAGISTVKVTLLVTGSLLILYYVSSHLNIKDKNIYYASNYAYDTMNLIFNSFSITSRFLETIYSITSYFTNLAKRNMNFWNSVNRLPRGTSFISTVIGIFLGILISSTLAKTWGWDKNMQISMKEILNMMSVSIGILIFLNMKDLFTVLYLKLLYIIPSNNLADEEYRKKLIKKDILGKAIVTSYETMLEKYPFLKNKKIKITFIDQAIPNMFIYSMNKNYVIGIVNKKVWSTLFTQKEIEAVLYHEFGHMLTIEPNNLTMYLLMDSFTNLLFNKLLLLLLFNTKNKGTNATLYIILANLFLGIYKTYKRLKEESEADSFSVYMDRKEELISSLQKLHVIYEKIILKLTVGNNVAYKTFLPHFITNKTRIKLINRMKKFYSSNNSSVNKLSFLKPPDLSKVFLKQKYSNINHHTKK